MKRRKFLKKATLTAATGLAAPYILPSGRLFAATGARIANHVVFVLFGGGLRNQETVSQQYLANQGLATEGNIMPNMLEGTLPTSNLVFDPWNTAISTPLSKQGTLFKEVRYTQGPTGHYNGHTVAMTGNYTETGINLQVNPDFPTVFEYYRKHSDPAKAAINSWWLSEGLGPYPALNYSRHPLYGAQYGANYLRPASIFGQAGYEQFGNAETYHEEDVQRILKVKSLLDKNFHKNVSDLPGIQNTSENRERIKTFLLQELEDAENNNFDVATPDGSYDGLTGDLINISSAWHVLREFQPELTVINTINSDVCHDNFSLSLDYMHRADYGIGWLWNQIQNHPVLANDTIMICMPEHGRNLEPNTITDGNGFGAYDHTGTENARRIFTLIVGPPDKVVQDQSLGNPNTPVAESIDVVPTIARILGFDDQIPAGMLPGRVLEEALV